MSADKGDPIVSKFVSETTIQLIRYYYNIEDSLGVSTVVWPPDTTQLSLGSANIFHLESAHWTDTFKYSKYCATESKVAMTKPALRQARNCGPTQEIFNLTQHILQKPR